LLGQVQLYPPVYFGDNQNQPQPSPDSKPKASDIIKAIGEALAQVLEALFGTKRAARAEGQAYRYTIEQQQRQMMNMMMMFGIFLIVIVLLSIFSARRGGRED
jgi:predicted RND superfamily exporter protein